MPENIIWTTNTEPKNHLSGSSASSSFNGRIQNPYLIGVQSKFRRKYTNKSLFLIFLLIVVIFLIIGIITIALMKCSSDKICKTKECLRSAADLLQSMNIQVDPCEDFYKFTCGQWPDIHPRPDSASSHDWFNEKQTKIFRKIRDFLQMNDTDDDPLPVQQTRMMYKACMDTEAMDELGYEPIKDYLKKFEIPEIPSYLNATDAESSFEWIKTTALIKQKMGFDLFIGFDIFPDPTNGSINRLVLGSPEQGSDLPYHDSDLDKRYQAAKHKLFQIQVAEDGEIEGSGTTEEKPQEENSEAMKAYVMFVRDTMAILIKKFKPDFDVSMNMQSIENAAKVTVEMTKTIYTFTQQAENQTKGLDDPYEVNFLMYKVTDIQNLTDTYIAPKPALPIWAKFLNAIFENVPEAQLNLDSDLILTSKGDVLYLAMLSEFISATPASHIELFIWWNIVEELILHTTTEMRKLHYEYIMKITTIEGGQSRSLYCARGVNKQMGMAVSHAIAEGTFLNVTKPKVALMLKNIRESFNGLVRDTTWMDWPTKKSTLEKSEAMQSLIGFPEWIMNKTLLEDYYGGIIINSTRHLDNMMGILQWQIMIKLTKWRNQNLLGWATSPTNVNAFHTFQANAITVPLGILQYPFYDLGLEALNYGAIGTILGHELTHGFDDSGRRFDKNGNLRQWWTNSTVNEYVNKTTCFINQYAGYYLPEVSEYINGELTLGENIADNGGLREAYYAYKKYMASGDDENLYLPGLENYTHEQLFFISFGNLWCESSTAAATKWALEDSHCPGRIRLRGVLTNSREFTETFKCAKGSGMNPVRDRCLIW